MPRLKAEIADGVRIPPRSGRPRPEPKPEPKRVKQGTVLVADLLAQFPGTLGDGVHELTVTRVEGRGSSVTMHVKDDSGAVAEVTLGSPGRARDRRLRILLGRDDLEDVAEIREALQGKRVRVRLTTYGFGDGEYQSEYRGVERA